MSNDCAGTWQGGRKKVRLLQTDHSSMRLKRLFDFLRILLGNTLLEHLRSRLDKLLGLEVIIMKRGFTPMKGWKAGADTHLDEGKVRHNRLDLFDDLRLGTSVERLEFHIE